MSIIKPVIAWWSGGVTSAVACWLAILFFGKENVRIFSHAKPNTNMKTQSSQQQPLEGEIELFEDLLRLYKYWCRETKRNGGVLLGKSITEFIEYISRRLPTPPVSDEELEREAEEAYPIVNDKILNHDNALKRTGWLTAARKYTGLNK